MMERNTNVFKFQGSKMIVSAKGPNTNFVNKNFTMDTSLRPNMFLNLPRNFEKQSSAASVASSQQSIYYRRDISPTASVCSDFQPRNFHQPFFSRGFSQQSVYNNRAVSPVSMRSIDSTASRADTIKSCINTINNQCFTEDEWKIIKHAVKRNCEYRKKAQKRRKKQMSIKNFQNCYEDDGEQGSSSAISNDDCVSTRTGYSCRQFSQRNGLLQNENNLYSQNNIMCGPKNTFSQRYTRGQANISSMQRNTLNASIVSTKSMQNMTMMSQRDRFRGGFQFPSQKFNNRYTLYEEQHQVGSKQFPEADCANKKINVQRDQIDVLSDENDNIFSDTTEKQKTAAKKSRKRKAERLCDIPNPTTKKPKSCSSNEKVKKQTQNIDNNEENEFEFVKPQFPVKKSAPVKPREKMISKSSGIPDILCSTQENEISQPQVVLAPSPEPHVESEHQDNTELTTSDMSMRPSFMKRKLFTQTLDVTERKYNSFDSGSADSPQKNIYSALSREKHKTRKLVTSQSLLSRDVNQDDDNLLDLIHKIVPANQVNSTITANTTKPRVSGTKNIDDKWDITSIISICNNESVSETYTDDEIFRVSIDDTKSKPQEKPVSKKNKQEGKNNVANKPETKKAENNANPINDKNVKDVINTNSRNVGNMKLQSDRNVKSRSNANQINNDNTKDVGNIKITNNKNIKDIEESKFTNKKIVKEVDDIKLANNKYVKDVGNMKTASSKNIKDIDEIKLTNDKIVKDVGDEKLLNSKDVVSRNPISNKKYKDLDNKHNTNNKNNKDVKRMLQAPPRMDTPVKPCPPKRVMLNCSSIDAFWDVRVDDSDQESTARRHLSPVLVHNHTDLSQNHGINPMQSGPDTQPTSSTKTNKTPALTPLVVLQDVQKIPKKQASKNLTNKTQSKTKKKSDVNSQPEKMVKNNNGTPNMSLRSRRLINLSAALGSANNSDLKENDTSLKENIPTKTKVQKKEKAEKKGTQDKNSKTKPTKITKSRNKKDNDSLIDNSKKRVEAPKSHNITSKVQKPADQMKVDICKVLRSRNIDLSSSFNSDKFELTVTRPRKSRTPNMLANNKIRNRATKS